MKVDGRALTPTLSPRERGRGGADPFSLREKVASDSWPDEGAAAIDALDWPAIEARTRRLRLRSRAKTADG